MDAAPRRAEAQRSPTPISFSTAILLAIALGLCGGYLDLVIIIVRKYWVNDLQYFWSGRDFPWSVPVVHVVLLAIPAVLLVILSRRWRGRVPLDAAVWLLTTLAIWGALLRAPIYGACALILAAGLGRWIKGPIVQIIQYPRRWSAVLAGLVGLLTALAALSSGRHALERYRARAALPAPPPGARNVLLIVWDTVRAYNMGLYGYPRPTTPNLARWARQGVRFPIAMAPASWTLPSHSCFLTGQWPYKLNTQWKNALDAHQPTLAEYLASRGYQTVGFAANTTCCSYETGLDRGFTDFEDYPLSLPFVLGRTVAGRWLLTQLLAHGDFRQRKWIESQSRDARGINLAFLDWIHSRQPERPFFAFLNYFDAHDPYVAPPGFAGRSGMKPRTARDFQFLFDYTHANKATAAARDLVMARDCYDDCIAFLDDQLGRLLTALQDQGLLANTVVIVTSDHGEGFGDHRVFGHGTGLNLDQIGVPLVIVAPGVPAGHAVSDHVSLRDLLPPSLTWSVSRPARRLPAVRWRHSGSRLADGFPRS
jgi:hypothetical protein